jgi:hypothetical protein
LFIHRKNSLILNVDPSSNKGIAFSVAVDASLSDPCSERRTIRNHQGCSYTLNIMPYEHNSIVSCVDAGDKFAPQLICAQLFPTVLEVVRRCGAAFAMVGMANHQSQDGRNLLIAL